MKRIDFSKTLSEPSIGIWIQNSYDDEHENSLAIYLGRRCWWFKLDRPLIKPIETWVDTSHYEWATPGPDGRCGFTHLTRKQFGFELTKTCLRLFHGAMSDRWPNPHRTYWYFPWTQIRRVRYDFFDRNGDFFATVPDAPNGGIDFELLRVVEDTVPKAIYTMFDPYTKDKVTATIYQTESEYRLGIKWAKFIGYLVPSNVYRFINVEFDKETGPESGSWKGGTMGYRAIMLNGETLPDAALRRFIEDGFSDITRIR